MTQALPQDLAGWLAAEAEGIDSGDVPAALILPRLADAGLVRIGVPGDLGGQGGTVMDAVQAVAAVARESLAAAFMLWGHRCFVEFMVQTPNNALRDRLLPDLLAGRVAGASGLSNVMKFLAGLEPLQMTARPEGEDLVIDGMLPWVTNLRGQGFFVAAAADPADGGPAMIVALAHDDPGVRRSADLSLMAMRSSDTAAVRIDGARIGRDRIIAANAPEWLPGVRPVFIALQCGMAIGLARRSLAEAGAAGGAGRAVLAAPVAALQARLDQVTASLDAGLGSGAFVSRPAALFELRIALSDIVFEAVALELQAGGGRCYLQGPGQGFARRWREAAFIPVITPSTVQLRTILAAASKAA
ncbi:acyl-CoA dehydrogenase family protein [Paracoccus benzoatiresistens]|uniref:Acyl-CoA dehydrogenase family protein n=1 Tax=Paracoccus benzoatiresistens TaxID=2997341 RepID=A0ABT4J1Z6_9RHOB|nr:acyl-CoA dehydrogenase family protein [Paracoccus sp. EF6]MCZ0960657.1 acyl-CoA dehydrogenase family protein [Paracoccus sp. EF6]